MIFLKKNFFFFKFYSLERRGPECVWVGRAGCSRRGSGGSRWLHSARRRACRRARAAASPPGSSSRPRGWRRG